MSFYYKVILNIFIITLSLSLFSCHSQKILVSSQKRLEIPKKKAEINPSKRAQSYFARGDYQKSLDAYNVTDLKNPADSKLLHSYLETIKKIKDKADRSFEKRDFASSGRIYHILLRNYTRFDKIRQHMPLDSKFLTARIEDCSVSLTKKGLEYYRMGNLSQAISIWESILIFDPDNAEIKKAVDTASIQLKNLKHKD